MNRNFTFIGALLLIALLPIQLLSQKPNKPDAAELHQAIKKLNVLGSVLYVAAHPDDENQRFISYCANEKLYEVTYLSLTRGDGGQNLIGPELRELLGVLRTEELLMARSVDGGQQRFSRANDFGYSKTPTETFQVWDKDAVLSDVVWTMRLVQPDVVVDRFYHGDKYSTHGHHTASAMLSVEAFDLAGHKDVYPEQLKFVAPWQPGRIFFNTSWWFYGSREKFDAADKTNLYPLDLGVYLPLKGKSNNEVAAEARSMHRCQGFGSLTSRGESVDWFEYIKGDKPSDKDPFAGINTTWTRVEGGAPIGELMTKINQEYRSDNPAASVPDLLKAMQMIKALPDGYWKRVKLEEIKEVIKGCLGLYLESSTDIQSASPGDALNIRLEAVNRSSFDVRLNEVYASGGGFDTLLFRPLANNQVLELKTKLSIPSDAPYTAPYWLLDKASLGMYTVADQQLRGQPEAPRFLKFKWAISVEGIPIEYYTEVANKAEEAAVGEIWRPFEILPPVFLEFEQGNYLFTEAQKEVKVRVRSGSDQLKGTLHIECPADWKVQFAPGADEFSFQHKGEEKLLSFTVTAPDGAQTAELRAIAKLGSAEYGYQMTPINYPHIPRQSVLTPALARASRVKVVTLAKNVGYYMGAGDAVPDALRLIGCKVTLLEDKDLTADNLKQFDAVVLGIRAYNTKEGLILGQSELFKYAENGGTLITQYNTNADLVSKDLSPLPLKLSRDRVTDETAKVDFLLPQNRVLNIPNKLDATDFDGWVQERGLYFPNEWDPAFEAPIAFADPGEPANAGSLLIAKYGKGHFVYTGLSFFRELPVGVPGAYRLFANILSLGVAAP